MWLPGFERWEIRGRLGVPYDEYDDPKGMVHTTQGTSIEGAVQAYAAYPPQLIVDPWRKRKVQHISLLNAGYALWNEDVDDSRCVQIEIVGYAEDTPSWPDEVYKWLGEEVARPLHELFGIPYVEVWKGFKSPADVDYVLASASSPLRLTQAEIDRFSGWLAHQHSPGDNHWDAGGFKCGLMLAYAQGKRGDADMTLVKGSNDAVWLVSAEGRRHVETGEEAAAHAKRMGDAVVISDEALATIPVIGEAVWNYGLPVSDTDPLSAPFRAAHRHMARLYEEAGKAAPVSLTPEQLDDLSERVQAGLITKLAPLFELADRLKD